MVTQDIARPKVTFQGDAKQLEATTKAVSKQFNALNKRIDGLERSSKGADLSLIHI